MTQPTPVVKWLRSLISNTHWGGSARASPADAVHSDLYFLFLFSFFLSPPDEWQHDT